MLYPRHILRHAKLPEGKGNMHNCTHSTIQQNPLCGDTITWQAIVDKNGKITDITWSGEGCVISQAAASILFTKLKGKKLSSIKKIKNQDFFKSLSITLSPTRQKCALLPLEAIKQL